MHGVEQVVYNKNKARRLTDALASLLKANKLWEESIQLRLPDSEGLCLIAFRTAENARKLLELKQVSLIDITISFSRSKPTETSVMLYQLPLDVWPQLIREELKPFRPTRVDIKKDKGFFTDTAVVKLLCHKNQLPAKFTVMGKKCPKRILKERPPAANNERQVKAPQKNTPAKQTSSNGVKEAKARQQLSPQDSQQIRAYSDSDDDMEGNLGSSSESSHSSPPPPTPDKPVHRKTQEQRISKPRKKSPLKLPIQTDVNMVNIGGLKAVFVTYPKGYSKAKATQEPAPTKDSPFTLPQPVAPRTKEQEQTAQVESKLGTPHTKDSPSKQERMFLKPQTRIHTPVKQSPLPATHGPDARGRSSATSDNSRQTTMYRFLSESPSKKRKESDPLSPQKTHPVE